MIPPLPHLICRQLAYFCLWALLPALAAAPAGAANSGKVALVLKALSDPHCYRMEAGVRQHALETGTKLEIFGLTRATHVTHQIGIIENLISRGYGAIIIAPWDSSQPFVPDEISGNTVSWGWSTMWSDSTWYFDVVVQIDDAVEGGAVLTNTIEAYGDSPYDVEPYYANNASSATITISEAQIFLPVVVRES